MPVTEPWPQTEQEAFDRVVRHLHKQGKKSTYEGQCVYRHPDGLMCAAGCLMPDSEYCKDMETKTFRYLIETKRVSCSPHLMKCIDDLQYIHDGEKVESWQNVLRDFAQCRNLSTDVLDECYKSPHPDNAA